MPAKRPAPPKLPARASLAGRMKSLPHVPRPGPMKHSVPRETPFHKALGSLVKKGPIPRPQIPHAPIFGKPSSKAPTASLASKLQPLAIGKRKSNVPKKSKGPPRAR